MLMCINKNSVEYQSLKNRAGIPESNLEAICRRFLTDYDRFPNLDEIRNANSELYLRDKFKIKDNNSVHLQTILDETGKQSLPEAIVEINNTNTDLEVDVFPIIDEGITIIKHRPTTTNREATKVEQDEIVNSFIGLSESMVKLNELYGIRINTITSEELAQPKWKGLVKDANFVKGFIYNGEIYINIDRASVDTPIHELMHMLIGELRFKNADLYQQLIESVESLSNYNQYLDDYEGYSRNDANEEIFVSEVSKLLTGQETQLNELDNKTKYEILYKIKRLLDTVLMGQLSVKTISDQRLFNMSLKQLAHEVGSETFKNKFSGTFNVANSELHRKLNNIKKDLIKNGELIQQCD